MALREWVGSMGFCWRGLESARSEQGSSIIGCQVTTSESGGPLWKLIPARMCELLVGLGEVDLVGIDDAGDGPLEVVIRSRKARPTCEGCRGRVWSKGYRMVVLVDLPAFGRPVRLRWRKRRWTCPNPDRAPRSFVEQDPTIGAARALLTSRAARWAKALLEADTPWVGMVEAVGVDETLFWRRGRWRTKVWCTSVVDVGARQLIDIVPGRTADSAASWFRSQPPEWRDGIRWAVSGHVRSVSEGL